MTTFDGLTIYSTADSGTITIIGEGSLYVSGSLSGILSSSGLTVAGGTVEAAGSSLGIGGGNNITISDGNVTARGAGQNSGIGVSAKNLTINGGNVTVTGNWRAINSAETNIVTNSISGTGWTNADGTENEAYIVPGEYPASSMRAYRKVQFPATNAPVASVTKNGATPILYTNFDRAVTAWNGAGAGATLTLLAAITTTNTVEVNGGSSEHPKVLDLNGYGILYKASTGGVIKVIQGEYLQLKDDADPKQHFIKIENGRGIEVSDQAVKSGTWVEVTGGYITGGSADTDGGGGVYVAGTFSMLGGNIIGNVARYGGGVLVSNYGNGSISGGTVTKNTANDHGGGIYNSGALSVSGNPDITGNKCGNADCNVELGNNSYIKITGKLNGTEPIGVTMVSKTGVFTNSSETTNNDTGKFASDDSNYTVGKNASGQLLLGTPVNVTFNENGHGTAPDVQTVASGGIITKPEDPTESGYIFGGWYREESCTTEWNFATDTVSANTILYAKWTAGYSITIETSHGGTVTFADPKIGEKGAKAGDTIQLTVTPNINFVLDQLTVINTTTKETITTQSTETGQSFTMPVSNVSVTASFKSAYEWRYYQFSTETDTIRAEGKSGSESVYAHLTLYPDNTVIGDKKVYNGSEVTISLEGLSEWTDYGLAVPDIVYSPGSSKNVGQYSVSISVSDITATKSYQIVPKEVTVSGIVAKSKVYDGKPDAELDLTNAAFAAGDIVAGDRVGISAAGQFTMKTAGEGRTAEVTVTLTGNDKTNYSLSSESQKTAYADYIYNKSLELNWGDTTSFPYNGSEQKPEATIKGVIDGDDCIVNVTSIPSTSINVGDYTATAVLNGNDHTNYNLSAENTKSFSITKIDPFVHVPTVKTGLEYNKSSQELVNAGSASGGTMMYVLGTNDTTAPTDGYNSTVPAEANAGEYYVWYKVDGDDNHNNTEPVCLTVPIAKAASTANPLAGLTATYGQTLNDVTLENPTGNTPGTWAWVDPATTSVGNAGEHTFKANFTPEDTANYNSVSNVDVTVTVGKAAGSISYGASEITKTYGEEAFTNELNHTGDGTVTYASNNAGAATVDSNGVVTIVKAGTATITATVADGANYTYATNTASYILTVNKATAPDITVPTLNPITYDTSKTLASVALPDGWIWSDSSIVPTVNNNGYSAALTVDDANYDYTSVEGYDSGTHTVTRTISLTVNKADSTVSRAPTAKTGLVYNSSAQELINAGSASGGEMQYAIGTNATTVPTENWSTTIPTASAAGTYYVWYKVVGDANHKDTDPAKVKVSIEKASVKNAVVSLDQNSFVYDGSKHTVSVIGVKLGETTLVSGTDYEVTGDTTGTDKGNYKLSVTGKGNYKDTATASWSIGTATPTITTVPTASAIAYGQTLKNSTLSGGAAKVGEAAVPGSFTWKAPDTAPSVSDSDKTKYLVTFTPKDTDNYASTECKVKVTVNKAESTVKTAPVAKTLNFNGQAQELVTAGSTETGTIQYALGTDATIAPATGYSSSIPTATDSGTYYVWYKVVGDENHNNTEPVKVEASIAKASIADAVVTLNPTSLIYNGSEQKVNVTSVKLGKTLLVLNTDYEVTSGTTGTDKGTYTVTVTGKGNYKDKATSSWSIGFATPEIKVKLR